MNQPYPFYNSIPRRRQHELYQQVPSSYNLYHQQQANFQSGQHFNASIHQQPYYQPYNQQYQHPFQQPLFGSGGHMQGQFMNTPYHTPYPKSVPNLKQQPSGLQTVISQFKKSDGQLDYSKMMDTAGQMMSAVNQMGGLFKGVASIFK
jgi:hypothetical protein